MRIATRDPESGAYVESSPDTCRLYRNASDAGFSGCIVAGSYTDPPGRYPSLRLFVPGRDLPRVIIGGAS
jgi:hypothetical protein